MFETCDWNDEGDSRTPETTESEKTCSAQKGAVGRKKRLKRTRQLLEVLRSLNTSSRLHPDLLPPHPEASPPKRRKKPAADVVSTEASHLTDAAVEERLLESGERLSRQQWRNKLKNKRRNRNKFKLVSQTARKMGGKDGSAARDGGAEEAAARGETPQIQGDGKVKPQQSRAKQNGAMSGGGGEETPTPPGNSAQRRQRTKPVGAGELRTPVCGHRGDRAPQQVVTPRERARLQKLKKLMQREAGGKTPSEEDHHGAGSDADSGEADGGEADQDPSAALRSRMEERLSSARFRYINEQLYTSDSGGAVRLFQQDPEAFSIYHSGFSQQIQRWPLSPITGIIKYIKNRPSSLVVADFGCGDAFLARSVRNTVHSFDLVALNPRVTVCDMAKVPLPDDSVDIAVFCLSLMGKNLSDFLQEGNRVLKLGGVLLVAEVSSRFDEVRQFLTAMSQLGFKIVNKNTENSYFFFFEFSKTGPARNAANHPGLQLKPCLYKKR